MKRDRVAVAVLVAGVVGLSAGVLSGKGVSKKPLYDASDRSRESACDPSRKIFPHDIHLDPKNEAMKEIAGQCSYCHEYVGEKTEKRKGERNGDIRRAGHKTCLSCHGIVSDPKIPSFYALKEEERTICQNCHANQMDASGKEIPDSYNDMDKPLTPISYGIPAEKPCEITYGFDFSHKAHEKTPDGKEVACGLCHQEIRDCFKPKLGPDGKPLLDDFGIEICEEEVNPATKKPEPAHRQMVSTPGHPQCFACHGTKEGTATGEPIIKEAFDKANPKKCDGCHKLNVPTAMRGVSYYVTSRDEWADKFTHRTHTDYLEKRAAKTSKDEGANYNCVSCHKTQVEATTITDIGKRMSKDLNMTSLCFTCHNGSIAFSGTLKCTACHGGSKGTNPPGSHGKK